jgi:hypothetical protein
LNKTGNKGANRPPSANSAAPKLPASGSAPMRPPPAAHHTNPQEFMKTPQAGVSGSV